MTSPSRPDGQRIGPAPTPATPDITPHAAPHAAAVRPSPIVAHVDPSRFQSLKDKQPQTAPPPWSVDDAAALYSIRQWGQGYFSVNPQGRVAVHPTKDPSRSIDLKRLVDELLERDLQTPLLIRFTDILKHRVWEIQDAFASAIREHQYQGGYRCVYPIKVNQQRHVVEEILDFGRPFGFGVEAGSKPELLAVMAIVEDDHVPIICNGFKDDQFIEAVTLAAKVGKNIIPVVEKFSELKLIAKHAKRHTIRPSIGIRVKLATKGAGRWEHSSGARSKFGLFATEVLAAVSFLRDNGMLDCLKLLHFHLGSQINNIRSIKGAVNELMRVYVELQQAGASLEYVDVGGGLGVDYDGSKTTFESSINYGLQEYANDIVYHAKQVCDAADVPHPTIISESGRAMVAYHSVLVFDVLGSTGINGFDIPDQLADGTNQSTNDKQQQVPTPVVTLLESYHGLDRGNYAEYYHDAQVAWDEALNLFNLGYCSLAHRALAERLYFGICRKVLEIVEQLDHVPDEFLSLEATLSDTYFCNFSIFQSIPDSWAIDQLFPIMPIHRLDERPSRRGILADITCDSDGTIDRFIAPNDAKPVIDLHPFTGADYYLAAFLIGAYQEILGDMHNLFGDTNAVHVSLDDNGQVSIDEVIEGDRVRDVLHYVQFSADELKRKMRKRIERALRDQKLTFEESRLLLRFYESGLERYTYLQ